MRFLRIRDVMSRTGLSRSGIYRAVNEGEFPRPYSLGARSVGWREDEVMTWQTGRSIVQRKPVRPSNEVAA